MEEEMQFGYSVFDSAPPLFFIILAIIVVVAIYTVTKNLAVWQKNNQSPILDVPARIVAKRTSIRGGGESRVRHFYFVTFEVLNGDRMELEVKGREFGLLSEGDEGNLQFQGTRYLGFTRMPSSGVGVE
ncbi:DUF2500 domain-containing protein [Bacillus sp. 1P06AnD]|uniref:DUF2500 domain-containing protein n=1 Tax=Bacillus sp. 1P06AnD TaxID=3132208 RepID=UPI0039A2A1A6